MINVGRDWKSTLTAPLQRYTDVTEHLGNIKQDLVL